MGKRQRTKLKGKWPFYCSELRFSKSLLFLLRIENGLFWNSLFLQGVTVVCFICRASKREGDRTLGQTTNPLMALLEVWKPPVSAFVHVGWATYTSPSCFLCLLQMNDTYADFVLNLS